MAIVIGDIHGDIRKVRAFLSYRPTEEHIFLGDLVDSRQDGVTLDDELECLDLILATESTVLWGNHDLTYTQEKPWRCLTKHYIRIADIEKYLSNNDYLRSLYEEDGDLFVRHVFQSRFEKQKHRIKAAYALDGWLFTHAGISPGIAKIIPQEIIESKDQEKIAAWLNEEFLRELSIPIDLTGEGVQRYGNGPLFNVAYCRGGSDYFGGIFWFDEEAEQIDPSPLAGKQIFGHSPVSRPERRLNWINMNSVGEGIWVFDTKLDQLIDISDQAAGNPE
jgi:predicted phosphodiesterase